MSNSFRKLSFDIDGCRQQLDKLIREAERLEGTDDRIDKSDHAINAAMTGWHLHEWVWNAVKKIMQSDLPVADDPETQRQIRLQQEQKRRRLAELRIEISKELSVKPARVGKEEFGAFMAKRNPSIELCRIIATGTKHLDVDNTSGVEVETFVSAQEPTAPPSNTSQIQLVYGGTPKIRYGDTVIGSSEAFREAEQAWTDLIYGYKIDD